LHKAQHKEQHHTAKDYLPTTLHLTLRTGKPEEQRIEDEYLEIQGHRRMLGEQHTEQQYSRNGIETADDVVGDN
jgi:hypothetical protein